MRLRPLHILLAAVAGWGPAHAAGPVPITGVVELFTSEGCSSCPPADKLMESYSGRDGLLALSFNVDYWDNLGWKDTLASPKNSQRQRAYARSRGDGQVYTPQAVINGVTHAVGSDRVGIDSALKSTSAAGRALRLAIGVTASADGLDVALPARAAGRDGGGEATLLLVKFTPKVEVAIERGENSGHTIVYHNVVRDFSAIGRWNGAAAVTHVGQPALAGCTPGTCAIILQEGGSGPILGAAWVPGASGI